MEEFGLFLKKVRPVYRQRRGVAALNINSDLYQMRGEALPIHSTPRLPLGERLCVRGRGVEGWSDKAASG
jgi:hypothetical protein